MVGFAGNRICRSRSALARVRICAKALCTTSPTPGCGLVFTAPFIPAHRPVLSIPAIQGFLLPARISRSGACSHPGSDLLGIQRETAALPYGSLTGLPMISVDRSVLAAVPARHHGVSA